MRRVVLIGLGSSFLFLFVFGVGPAAAKGEDSHASVTIAGTGLPGGSITLGDDGVTFAFGSGLWERKWDVPNIGGALEPGVDLGPAYVVRVVMVCEPGERSRYRQRLYPNAPDGAQLYTPEGITVCGAPAEAGYDPLGATLEGLLRAHGVEFHPADASPSERDTPAGNADASGPSLAFVGVPLALALLGGGEIVRRRRRR
jgi:hypothetical protein